MESETLQEINKYMKDTGYHQRLLLESAGNGDDSAAIELLLETDMPKTQYPLLTTVYPEEVDTFLKGIMTGFNLIGY